MAHVDAAARGVVAEALEGAAEDSGEQQVLGRPLRAGAERRPVLGADRVSLAEIDRIAEFLRLERHSC